MTFLIRTRLLIRVPLEGVPSPSAVPTPPLQLYSDLVCRVCLVQETVTGTMWLLFCSWGQLCFRHLVIVMITNNNNMLHNRPLAPVSVLQQLHCTDLLPGPSLSTQGSLTKIICCFLEFSKCSLFLDEWKLKKKKITPLGMNHQHERGRFGQLDFLGKKCSVSDICTWLGKKMRLIHYKSQCFSLP